MQLPDMPVFIISAPSGAGKNSLIELLLRDEMRLSYAISTTTRTPRPGEVNGKHYYFCSRDEFLKLVAEKAFIEHAEILGNLYGTRYSEIERIRQMGKSPVLDIDVQGFEILRAQGLRMVTIFVVPPSLEELRRRLEFRGTESQEEIDKRMQLAEHEMKQQARYDVVVVNNDIEQALAELLVIIRKHFA